MENGRKKWIAHRFCNLTAANGTFPATAWTSSPTRGWEDEARACREEQEAATTSLGTSAALGAHGRVHFSRQNAEKRPASGTAPPPLPGQPSSPCPTEAFTHPAATPVIKGRETLQGASVALKGRLPTLAQPPVLPCRRGMLLRGAAAHPMHEARSSSQARQWR